MVKGTLSLIQELQRIQTQIDQGKVVARVEGLDVYASDLTSLAPGNSLSGGVMEAYLKIIKKTFDVEIFPAAIFTSLREKGVNFVVKCHKGIQTITNNFLIILLNLSEQWHWTGLWVDLKMATLHYFNSSHEPLNNTDIQMIVQFLVAMHLLPTYYPIIVNHTDIPKQNGGVNCGPHLIVNMHNCMLASQNKNKMLVDESMMNHIRNDIGTCILGHSIGVGVMEEKTLETSDNNDILDEAKLFGMTTINGQEVNDELDQIIKMCQALQAKTQDRTGINHFNPSASYLQNLRAQSKPFVDIVGGRECTVNHGNNWRNFLKLSEVLDNFSSDKEEAWAKLVAHLTAEPAVSIRWLTTKRNLKCRSPFQFRFGKLSSFKRIRKITELACPRFKMVCSKEKSS